MLTLVVMPSSSTFSSGDTVLHHQPKHKKVTTPYNAEPYKMSRIKGSVITATKDGHSITRNLSFVKKIPTVLQSTPPDSDTPPPRHSSRHNRRPLPYPHEYELLLIADSLCHLGQSECSCVPLHHLCLIYRYRLLPPAIGPPQLQPMSLRSCQGAQLLV